MLSQTSIEWAVDFIADHSDGDLFPRVQEIEAIRDLKSEFVAMVAGKQLADFPPSAHRRFLVPKDEVSYRQATQLDPQDSLLLTALVHQFGSGIEARRLAPQQVFSNRFDPTESQGLYDSRDAWDAFWTEARLRARSASSMLHCDIADFYNQVYHHEVENQLRESGFPNQATKWIIKLLESTTAGVSRGVPIGPHAAHLLAEATLIPIDSSLRDSGLNFIRFVDDFLVFSDSTRESKSALATIARILDQPQRLMLQRHKTKMFTQDEFLAFCDEMVEDRPITTEEESLIAIVRKYSGGNPYATIMFSQVSRDDWEAITAAGLRSIIEEYISQDPTDFIRLRWLYRRLAQIGHPGAIEVSLERIESLGPCFASICFYLGSVQEVPREQWLQLGDRLLALLVSPEVIDNEYFALMLLSLFARNPSLNHFPKLSARFSSASAMLRREILLAARSNAADGWIRQHKQSFPSMDDWQKMAFAYCASALPSDEKKYFLSRWVANRPIEKILAKWSKGT